jgi:hypothetical protein
MFQSLTGSIHTLALKDCNSTGVSIPHRFNHPHRFNSQVSIHNNASFNGELIVSIPHRFNSHVADKLGGKCFNPSQVQFTLETS